MEERIAILVCFNTDSKKFKSTHERNVFYRELYGYKQVVTKREKTYTYQKEGVLTQIPNMRVDNSSFIVAQNHLREVEKFFDEWEQKVRWRMLKVLMDDEMERIL